MTEFCSDNGLPEMALGMFGDMDDQSKNSGWQFAAADNTRCVQAVRINFPQLLFGCLKRLVYQAKQAVQTRTAFGFMP